VIAQNRPSAISQTQLNCQVVSLYKRRDLFIYRYRRFSDIRLVMAPEETSHSSAGIGQLHLSTLRSRLDAARVYENGQPYSPTDYLKWSPAGAIENELVFVVGIQDRLDA